MKIKEEALRKEWERNMRFTWTGEKFVVDHDERIPRMLVGIDRMTFELVRSDSKLFSPKFSSDGDIEVAGNKLGRDLIALLRTFDPFLVRQYFSSHAMSPYFELWEDHWDEVCSLLLLGTDVASVNAANQFVDRIRAVARRDDFTRVLRNHRRVASKNWQGFRTYIDSLFEKHSKLLVVRVDLGYRFNPLESVPSRSHVGELDVRKHLRKMLRYLRRRIPECVGSAWKLEYGASKGYHVHLLVFLDGHKCREGMTWGRRFCEKWDEITAGIGASWNCNADEESYRKRGLLGIGLIHYADQELRAGLVRTAMYLVKVDAYAKLKSKGKGRNFAHGEIEPKSPEGRVGRPRKVQGG